jgi:hypothetical protein
MTKQKARLQGDASQIVVVVAKEGERVTLCSILVRGRRCNREKHDETRHDVCEDSHVKPTSLVLRRPGNLKKPGIVCR